MNEDATQRMYREAEERGMSDYERGVKRHENPYWMDLPEQARRWQAGWDTAYELDRAD